MLKFGTSGIRALNTDFTSHEIKAVIHAFLLHAQELKQNSPIALAYDLRESSPFLKNHIIETLLNSGRQVFDCGNIPTPALAYFAQENKCLGIMITGSHIPADRNGIKFYLETGETLKRDDQSIFEKYQLFREMDAIKFTALTQQKSQGFIQECYAQAAKLFSERYYKFFSPKNLSGYKILFYQHSSVARDIYPEILRNLGAEVLCIGRSDTFIPVDTEALSSLDTYREWIIKNQADALISTDGDADRPLFMDGHGRVIPGDKLGALTSIYLGIEAIALPISCNSGILKNTEFKKMVSTKIGSPFVVEALNSLSKEFSTVAGFEANGGYILQTSIHRGNQFINSLPTRDSVLPALCILALAKARNKKIFEITELLHETETASGLLREVPIEKSQSIIQTISKHPDKFFHQNLPELNLNLQKINQLDGLRCEFQDNVVIHLRPSGNAPELRCYTEAKTYQQALHICDEVLLHISKL